MTSTARSQLLHDLRTQIGKIESAPHHPRRLEAAASGFAELDRLLPGGGFVGGTLIEWLGAGHGGLTLALAVGGRVARGRPVALIGDRIYPPALAALGVPLDRLIVVRPPDAKLSLWAWEQALRCEAIAVTLGRIDEASEAVMRRLQMAAVAGGGLGFLVRPKECRAETVWADVRLLVQGVPGRGEGSAWRLRVDLLRARGSFEGGTAHVEVDHEANDVPVASELAGPAGSP